MQLQESSKTISQFIVTVTDRSRDDTGSFRIRKLNVLVLNELGIESSLVALQMVAATFPNGMVIQLEERI